MQPPKPPADKSKSGQTMQILDFLRENIPSVGEKEEDDTALKEAQRKIKERKKMEDEPFEVGQMPNYITGRQ